MDTNAISLQSCTRHGLSMDSSSQVRAATPNSHPTSCDYDAQHVITLCQVRGMEFGCSSSSSAVSSAGGVRCRRQR